VFGGNGYMEDWPMARQLRDAQCHTIWEGTENICSLDVRRAIQGDAAHEALFARIERALDGAAGQPLLGTTVDTLAAATRDARDAVTHLDAVSTDLQLLHARRFAFFLADIAESAVLLDEASWSLATRDDARKALVANRFTRSHLAPTRANGVFDDDRTAIDHFETIVRYGALAPDAA
jgi:acyl-CoA dehydrogenase